MGSKFTDHKLSENGNGWTFKYPFFSSYVSLFLRSKDNRKTVETGLFNQTYQTEVENFALSFVVCRLFQVPKVTHTEFCQGRTMRWALAWSFYEDAVVPVSFSFTVFYNKRSQNKNRRAQRKGTRWIIIQLISVMLLFKSHYKLPQWIYGSLQQI